ncbi:family 78 glycoside hydrolase catalytic domain [Flavivirga aquimarina]|uniref:alpha-L-rhamnosidase n=1 Tax=Flavivirga aquimarina TaxID=2027862 RepID=A0ABT8WE35_9FLAO|nr:discoidin domain-containing protein [Flavivirga aquimarina]MDO5971400.1 family 78 glycoside hydrolase catalytic domain [Flavivirga aquimarina]
MFSQSIQVTASSSYEQSGWSIDNLIDGENSEVTDAKGWTSNNSTTTNHEEWVQLKFSELVSIYGIHLYSRDGGQGFPVDFIIEVSQDANTWKTVTNETNYTVTDSKNTFSFPEELVQYVKITGTSLRINPLDNNQYRMQFTEVDFNPDLVPDIEPEIPNDYSYILERITPSTISNVGSNVVLDFGKAAFASMEFTYTATTAHTVSIHLGEKLSGTSVDRNPGATIRYQKVDIPVVAGTNTYEVSLAEDVRNTAQGAIQIPSYAPVLMPYRYVEIENHEGTLLKEDFVQLAYFGPWDENASSFSSDDAILNQVWDLCKYSMKATSFMGYYIDGDRERIPYEADAYLNQLSHYGTDASYKIARNTIEYLMDHSTWPVEWQQHMVLMFYADYIYTGNTELISEYYDRIIDKSLYELRRGDGLISHENATASFINNELGFTYNQWATSKFTPIVDWPTTERDGFVFQSYNAVVNAFYYKSLLQLAEMAQAIGDTSNLNLFTAEAIKVKTAYNAVFFDTATGLYVDGEGTSHSSLHTNMMALAMGLVPDENIATVATFIKSKGMGCSVYGAQYLFEALYNAGEADYALELMTSQDTRSWYNMIRVGSTITLEAWDESYKSNLDWNHAWGAAPANLIPNYMWGIKPITPGFTKASIQPQLSTLKNTSIKVPTPNGGIEGVFEITTEGNDFYTITLPAGVEGEFSIPNTQLNLIHNSVSKNDVDLLILESGVHTIEIVGKSLGTEKLKDINLSIYPNPLLNSEILNIQIPDLTLAKASVINLTGQVLRTGDINKGRGSLSLNGLSSGMYIVKIVAEGKTYSKKIILQ